MFASAGYQGRSALPLGSKLIIRAAATSAAARPASLWVAAKIAAGFVEGLDRIRRYALRPSPAGRAIFAATRLAEMSFDPRLFFKAQAADQDRLAKARAQIVDGVFCQRRAAIDEIGGIGCGG